MSDEATEHWRAGGPSPARPGGALRALRESNLRRILSVIRDDGGVSQAEVARRTQLSRATVSNLVGELRRRGLVRSTERPRNGRACLEAVIGRSTNAVIGVDFGHRHVRVGIADLNGRVLGDEERVLPPDLGATESCSEAWAMASRLMARAGVRPDDLLQVGVGLPAPIDVIAGRVGWHGILHRWAELDPHATIHDVFGRPVVLDNDANLGALGELRQGAGRGYTNFIYINVATGVGAGLVIDGRVYHGTTGTAGEIGHMTVDPSGRICRCGNRGCVDAIVGAPGFLELLRTVYGEDLDVVRVIELARRRDGRCIRALAEAGHALGAVVSDLCNLLSPERVILAGVIFQAGEVILGPMRETVAQRAVPAAARAAEIVPSGLQERAEMIGAITLALEAVRAGTADDPLLRVG
ncbi:MAG TPA: ROK family transcriptional regulator [Candidatus Binatia bacterium]|nr:ROK family transcriptional regulator [Candidatus Binatia bacterium]